MCITHTVRLFHRHVTCPVALVVASCLALANPTALAGGDCSGDPGFVLTITSPIEIGSSYTVSLQGPGGNDLFLIVSSGQGPTDTPFGTFCLDFPPRLIFHLVLPDSGLVTFNRQMPCDSNLVGGIGYLQFIAVDRSTLDTGISNQSSITIVDGACDDRFCTYTQGAWGGACAGNNIACLRDAEFANVFPTGLTLGDQDGIDADSLFAVVLTSAAAVEAFLPQGDPSGTFDADATDPLATTAGLFGGQLAAAKINVAFDAAGLFNDTKNGNLILLGDVVFNGCVDDDLIGLSVSEVIEIADRVISGEFGACLDPGCQSVDIYDANGDTIPDVSIDNLKDALALVNETFDNCTGDFTCLGFP